MRRPAKVFMRVLVAGCGIVAFTGLAGCKRGGPAAPPPPPRTVLGPITVRDLTPPDEAPAHLDVEALGRALRARLLATGQFEAPAADAGAAAVTRVQVRVGIDGAEVEAKGVARARAELHLETRPAGAPGAINEQLEGVGEQTYAVPMPAPRGHADGGGSGREAVFAALVLRVSGDLVGDFAARRRLAQGSHEAVAAALRADGGALRLEAIRMVGERHLTGESTALLALLNDPDETTRDAALGSLIRLGDRRAVTELTRSRSLRDDREMRKIIEAISMLGGEEADDYLSFVASSHDDEEIRAEAAAARTRLQRRQAEGGAANPP
jgi:hypothetical protein